MRRRDFQAIGYTSRRNYRAALEEWLTTLHVDLFVTLSFSQNMRFQQARPLLGQWFARLDSHYLGRGWSRRKSDDRTFAIAVPENISTNLHYHCLVRLPTRGRAQPISECAAQLSGYWRRLVWGGTCDVEPIYDLPTLARYVSKQLVRPGYEQHYIIATEFHSRRDRSRNVSSGGRAPV
jgi:hypothetical protein